MSRAEPTRAQHAAARGERFTTAMAAIVRRLPFGLAGIVPPSLLGFAVINSCTFAVDLGLLTALHGGLRWPLAGEHHRGLHHRLRPELPA